MITVCAFCGKHFQARRSTAKYCSDKCRKRAHAGYPMPDFAAPDVAFAMTADELAEVVQQAHRATDDMGRASEHAPYPLGPRMRRCAEAFADALESEGL